MGLLRASSPASPVLRGGASAVLAAVLFGGTAPLVQRLGASSGPLASATLLQAGAALATVQFARKRGAASAEAPVRWAHAPRILLVALLGAVLAPPALTWGLQHTGATSASLLLNFEAVFTVLIAALIFGEAIGRRVALAVGVMLAGGVCLVLSGGGGRSAGLFGGVNLGSVAIVLATLGWAFDNSFSAPLASLNPTHVVRWKALVGAVFGLALSLVFRERFPSGGSFVGLVACGAVGYGLSLRLYLGAQRRIGTARTGSIFSLAPFLGASTAWAMGDRSGNGWTLAAGALFALGVYLHLAESHGHPHAHEALTHEHAHRHDDGHHDHEHEHEHDGQPHPDGQPVAGSHSHLHRHEPRVHEHPHAPDAHHRHEHGDVRDHEHD